MKFKFNFCCICSDKQNELHNLSNSSSNDLSCYEKLLLVIPEIVIYFFTIFYFILMVFFSYRVTQKIKIFKFAENVETN